MKRKAMAGLIVLTLALGGATAGRTEVNPVEARLLASLALQGYTILEDGYTWLGRLRIVAENGELHREIVVNPGTGEVLRDYAVRIDALAPDVSVALGGGHAGGTGTVAGGAATGTVATTGTQGILPPDSVTPDNVTPDTGLLTPALEN